MFFLRYICLSHHSLLRAKKNVIFATKMPSMPNDTTPQKQSKYDPFFSRSMEHPLIAQAFFMQHLPTHLRQAIDEDTFMRFDRTNTNVQLEQRRRDIAYKAQMEGNAKIIACVEHQGRPDSTMLARFLHYSADNIAACLQEDQAIPLIIQFLFYNGSKALYPYPTTLQNHYSHPEWSIQELSLRFHLVDATQISDEEFIKHGHCAPMCLLLKHGSDGNFELSPDAYREVFQACVEAIGDDYIHTMLNYAGELSNLVAGEKIFHFIEEVLIDKEDIIMTYAQKIEQRGKMQVAMTMLQAQEPKEKVSKFTGLTLHQVEKIIKEIRETLDK